MPASRWTWVPATAGSSSPERRSTPMSWCWPSMPAMPPCARRHGAPAVPPGVAACPTPCSWPRHSTSLPPELSGIASLVTVHFPWGSLLEAAIGRDPAGTDRLAALVAPGGRLRLLVSASQRDAVKGATALDPESIVRRLLDAWLRAGALPRDVGGRRRSRAVVMGTPPAQRAGDRRAWLIELRRVESGDGGTLHRMRA